MATVYRHCATDRPSVHPPGRRTARLPGGRSRNLDPGEAGVATLRQAMYEAGTLDRHQPPWPSIVYSSEISCLEPGIDVAWEKGRLTYHAPGSARAVRYAAPTHVVMIELRTSGLAQPGPCDLPLSNLALPATLYRDFWSAYTCLIYPGSRAAAAEPLDRLAERIIQLRDRPITPWLQAVVDDIHQAWQDPLSAAAIASRHGKSPEHLCRRFKCELGVTMRQYLVLLRLDLARGLLWSSDTPIAEVAAMTGFCDQSHLSRSLTALYGDTPKRFRCAARLSGLAAAAEGHCRTLLSRNRPKT